MQGTRKYGLTITIFLPSFQDTASVRVRGSKMRLLNTETLKLSEFCPEFPEYAILSHRWEEDEVSYQDLQANKNQEGAGYRKIQKCCEKALRDGYVWVWIDTCCIDKTSSAELSESINSMFKWYQTSAQCYAYLSDVEEVTCEGKRSHPSFNDSVWFTRGWTLQELLAPREMLFLDTNWNEIGTRASLNEEITTATGIPNRAYASLESYTVAQRMSWASNRKTTRVEDIAYSLLGIFDVNMPLLYGEGHRAFPRLQEEIIKRSDDESIFVWHVDDQQEERSLISKLQDQIHLALTENEKCLFAFPTRATGSGRLLAPRPSCFAHCASVRRDVFVWRRPYSLTNKGLEFMTLLFKDPEESKFEKLLIPLNCTDGGDVPLAISLTRSFGYWMRCGSAEMPGSAESLLEVMRNEDEARQIHISAQWPCHPVANVLLLNPRLNTESGEETITFQSPPARYEI